MTSPTTLFFVGTVAFQQRETKWDLCFQKISTMFCTEKKKKHDPKHSHDSWPTHYDIYKYYITIYNLTSANPTFPNIGIRNLSKHTKTTTAGHLQFVRGIALAATTSQVGHLRMVGKRCERSYGVDPNPIPSIWVFPKVVGFSPEI